MANTKISNLTGAASVTDASVFPVVDSGATKKVTGTQIKTYARSGLSTVAVSGSYTDLSNKPTLFDGNYNSLTNKPTIPSISGLATEAYVNSAVGAISIPEVPTNLSDLNNDIDAITLSSIGQFGFLTSQTQADWNEQISESPAYIHNKPTIPSLDGYATETFVNSAIAQVNGGGASTGNITISDTNLMSTNGDVTISFDQIASPAVVFSFTTSGEFIAPQVTTGALSTQQININYVRQVSNDTSISCLPNVDTVIYTGTASWQHTFKLLLKVEGNENSGQQGWDTQSCEMMIAKSFRNDTVAGSVYGLVYTSVNPLASFTTRWNAAINSVEVLCRPSSTTESVVVRSFVTEITTSD